MKNKLSLLLFLVLLAFSCGKKGQPIYDDGNNNCPPITLFLKTSGTTNLDITFEDNRRFAKLKDGKKQMEISYAEYIYLSKIEYLFNTTPIPTRKVLTPISTEGANLRPLQERESTYEGNQLLFESDITYVYTDELITVKRKRLDNNSEITQKYVLKNGNIASFDDGNGTVYTYKYDDKRNPFANRFLKYRFGAFDFFSENSVTEVEENKNGVRKITKNSYTYNGDGYPVTLKSLNEEGVVLEDYKFDYKSVVEGCY